jgi:hypothetical protein
MGATVATSQESGVDPFLDDLFVSARPARLAAPPPPPPPPAAPTKQPTVTGRQQAQPHRGPAATSTRRAASSSFEVVKTGLRFLRQILWWIRRAWLVALVIAGIVGFLGARSMGGATEVDAGPDGVITGIAPASVLVDVPGFQFGHRPDVREVGMPFGWENATEDAIGQDVRQITNAEGRVGALISISVAPEQMMDEGFRAELLDGTVGGTSTTKIGDNEAYMSTILINRRSATTASAFYENQLIIVGAFHERDAITILTHILENAP